MAEGYFITNKDRAKLRRLLDAQRPKSVNTEKQLHQASDVYVAKPTYTHIPPRVGDFPGSSLCDIYRIIEKAPVDLDADERPMLQLMDSRKTVYNISDTRRNYGEWLIVQKTKGGQWICLNQSAGETCIWFVLKQSLAPGGSAKAYLAEFDSNGELVVNQKSYFDLKVNETSRRWVSSHANQFTEYDVGAVLTVISGDGFYLEDFEIEEVTTGAFVDLVVYASNTVFSMLRPFTEFDVGLYITIQGGDGFDIGAFIISGVNEVTLPSGVTAVTATLTGFSGTVGSAGGWGFVDSSALCDCITAPDDIIGEMGSSNGHGYLFHRVMVEDTQVRHRATGTDDLTIIYKPLYLAEEPVPENPNGTEFTIVVYWDDDRQDDESPDSWLAVGSIITLDGLDDWIPGTYIVKGHYYNDSEEIYGVYLDRAPGVDGALHGVGTATVTTGAAGYACVETIEDIYEPTQNCIVSMQQLARIARASTTQDTLFTSTQAHCIDFVSMDAGQAPLNEQTVCGYTDLFSVEGEPLQIGSTENPFTEDDVDLLLFITDMEHVDEGVYLIYSVDEETGIATLATAYPWIYRDFQIPGSNPAQGSTSVSSSTAGFAEADEGLLLTITGQEDLGEGLFTNGDYDITEVAGGVATVDSTIGLETSTLGIGYLTGMTGGVGYTMKKLTVISNGWSGIAGSSVNIEWDEEEDAYRVVRQYPTPTANDQVLFTRGSMVVWEDTEEPDCDDVAGS